LSLFVYLSVCLLATLRINFGKDLHKIFREGWQWANEQMVKFQWRPDHRVDTVNTRIVFRSRHYWEIRKMFNGHKSAAHTNSPDGGTSKTCLGGGMHYALSQCF